jgi:uncharacterized protein YdeI (YjbR/CyaY-like superfamily)
MTTEAEIYFSEGCGRCTLGGTPQCKVHRWPEELALLRKIVLECGLIEEMKWGMPCYTYNKKNILVIAAFKGHCSLSFFKGMLMQDTEGIMEKAGENTQAIRLIKFRNTEKIAELYDLLKSYIFEAIELEKAGKKVELKKPSEFIIPEELNQKFDELPALKTAFEALTPGRQRAYLLHFTQPKQVKTRIDRIEKCIPQIFNGKGLNE